MRECVKQKVDLLFCQKEYDIVPFICSSLGFSIFFFSLFVLIYAPGKTIATYGIIVDSPNITLTQNGKTSNLLVLLNGGKAVRVRKPEWLNSSENKTVILQETTSMFLGIKRYDFYSKGKIFNHFIF